METKKSRIEKIEEILKEIENDTESMQYAVKRLLLGDEITLNYAWPKRGSFIISCKAKDSFGVESDWGTLSVTMPRNRIINRPSLQFLQSDPNMFPLLRLLLQL